MLKPDPTAESLADTMLARESTQREIISETISAAESGRPQESGRTYCAAWDSIHGPIDAGVASINLRTCVAGPVGIWHTHPGQEGLTSPVNSLPDMANVVFGSVDASIVPGTQTADVIVSPADPERAQAAFRQAVGAEITSARDVRSAITDRRINAVEARERARTALSGLIRTEPTGYTDLRGPEPKADPSAAVEASQAVCFCATSPEQPDGNSPEECLQRVDGQFQEAAETIESKARSMNISGIAISAAVGNVVGEVVNRVLFD